MIVKEGRRQCPGDLQAARRGGGPANLDQLAQVGVADEQAQVGEFHVRAALNGIYAAGLGGHHAQPGLVLARSLVGRLVLRFAAVDGDHQLLVGRGQLIQAGHERPLLHKAAAERLARQHQHRRHPPRARGDIHHPIQVDGRLHPRLVDCQVVGCRPAHGVPDDADTLQVQAADETGPGAALVQLGQLADDKARVVGHDLGDDLGRLDHFKVGGGLLVLHHAVGENGPGRDVGVVDGRDHVAAAGQVLALGGLHLHAGPGPVQKQHDRETLAIPAVQAPGHPQALFGMGGHQGELVEGERGQVIEPGKDPRQFGRAAEVRQERLLVIRHGGIVQLNHQLARRRGRLEERVSPPFVHPMEVLHPHGIIPGWRWQIKHRQGIGQVRAQPQEDHRHQPRANAQHQRGARPREPKTKLHQRVQDKQEDKQIGKGHLVAQAVQHSVSQEGRQVRNQRAGPRLAGRSFEQQHQRKQVRQKQHNFKRSHNTLGSKVSAQACRPSRYPMARISPSVLGLR